MPGIRRGRWAILRNPAVVAALIGATVAGIFGIIQIVISPGYFDRHEDARTERPIDVDSGSVATRLGNIRTALKARKEEAADIDVRRNAIIHLVAMSTEQPPEQYYNTAIGILVEYVKSNIDARRGPFDQVEVDDREPETYRPADIIDALEALASSSASSTSKASISATPISRTPRYQTASAAAPISGTRSSTTLLSGARENCRPTSETPTSSRPTSRGRNGQTSTSTAATSEKQPDKIRWRSSGTSAG